MKAITESIVRIRKFVAHKTPSKCRIFAVDREDPTQLVAVTKLGPSDLHVTDKLVSKLNTMLYGGDEAGYSALLEQLPDPVRLAVQAFLREHCANDDKDPWPFPDSADRVRLTYFAGPYGKEDLRDYLEGAYMIGLGIRVSNFVARYDGDDEIEWRVELFRDEPAATNDTDPRAWELPDGAPLLSTWTSSGKGHPVANALRIAHEASEAGRWVRIHTFEREQNDEVGAGAVSEFAVDIFDAPIPVSPDD